MSGDSVFLLHALLTGVFITFVYDGFIILRRVIPHKSFVESLEDLIFWIFCAIYVFSLLYRESNGTLRWFAVVGAMAGMILYKKTVSGILVKGATWLLSKVLWAFGRVLAFLCRPIGFLWKKVRRLHQHLQLRRRKIQGNLKIWLKSNLKALKIKLSKR